MKPPSYLKVPGWVADMEIAKEWNTSPVKLMGGSKLLWYVRARIYRDITARKNR